MACSACARRATKLLPKMGFPAVFDPAVDELPEWTLSNTFVTVSFKIPALQLRHTRTTILAWFTKLLFGSLKPMAARRLTPAENAQAEAKEFAARLLQEARSICLPPCSYSGGQCVDLLGNPCA